MPTKRKHRETSDRVSRDAGKLLALIRDGWEFWALDHYEAATGESDRNVTRLVKSVAGSALSQDETRGERKAKRHG